MGRAQWICSYIYLPNSIPPSINNNYVQAGISITLFTLSTVSNANAHHQPTWKLVNIAACKHQPSATISPGLWSSAISPPFGQWFRDIRMILDPVHHKTFQFHYRVENKNQDCISLKFRVRWELNQFILTLALQYKQLCIFWSRMKIQMSTQIWR